jgi:hypothetical protein
MEPQTQEDQSMRLLTNEEIKAVSGGDGWIGTNIAGGNGIGGTGPNGGTGTGGVSGVGGTGVTGGTGTGAGSHTLFIIGGGNSIG